MTTANSNNRASLLAGLRTGGVRSSSLNVPHTAAPAGVFNVPHFAQHQHQHNPNFFPEEDESDYLTDMPQQNGYNNRNIPMTSAVDGPNNRFAQQQAPRGMNPNSMPFSPGFGGPNTMSQATQMQMLQLEMMRIHAIQAQQYQMELLSQVQRQQQAQQAQQAQQIQMQQWEQRQQNTARERRASQVFNPPATAGPMSNAFDLRAATLSAQMRRANLNDQSQLGVGSPSDDHVPMTAALGGRFGSRSASLSSTSNPNIARFDDDGNPPPTPSSTTVISGGTSLGSPMSNNIHANAIVAPSKSDSASSWRRGGNNNSVLRGNRAVSSPILKITPPPSEHRVSPPLAAEGSPVTANGPKFRPQPLRFSAALSQPLPAVTIDNTDEDTDGETQSSTSSGKSSSPTTPRSSSSNEMPLSPREEASKRLYEGLGIGRPVSSTPSDQAQAYAAAAAGHRMVSQPTRQPRGPPSGADELGPKNFATRIRRKAIGGLGMLMGARERREVVEAF